MEPIQVTVFPLSFLDYDESKSTYAIISESLFERLFGDHDSTEGNILGINVYIDERQIAITCMPQNVEDDIVYLPCWATEHLETCDAFIKPVTMDAMLRARTLKVRILDDELDHGLIRDKLETYLYDFKFLQPNIVLNLMFEEAQYPAQILIESIIDEDGIECDGPALLGDELELDIAVTEEVIEEAVTETPVEPIVPEESVPVPETLQLPTKDEKEAIREARLRRFAN